MQTETKAKQKKNAKKNAKHKYGSDDKFDVLAISPMGN